MRLSPQSLRCEITDDDLLRCHGVRTFQTARQRWWYMALSRCDDEVLDDNIEGMSLKYRIMMRNPGGLFFNHFSADEHCVFI